MYISYLYAENMENHCLNMASIINKTVHEGNATNRLLMLHQIKDATVSSKIVIK